jgi:hypothetical protein
MQPVEAIGFFVVAPLAVLFSIAAIGIGLRIWYVMRIKQWEMSLKHTMLERGMSAEEITSVLEASTIEGAKKKMGCGSRRQQVGNDL